MPFIDGDLHYLLRCLGRSAMDIKISGLCRHADQVDVINFKSVPYKFNFLIANTNNIFYIRTITNGGYKWRLIVEDYFGDVITTNRVGFGDIMNLMIELKNNKTSKLESLKV